jgi:hypothetical protein
MATHDGGKGDSQRPLTVPKEQFDNNWDAIFDKNLNKERKPAVDVEVEADRDGETVEIKKTWNF